MQVVGWMKFYRKIQENWIWQSDEPYCMRSAWDYILLNANFEDVKTMRRGQLLEVKRGQMITSLRELSNEWKWSTGKVTRFLNRLEKENMILKEDVKNGTLLTIVNYEVYQGVENTNETPTKHQRNTDETLTKHQRNTNETLTKHQRNTLKEDKEDKEYNNINNNKECKEEKKSIKDVSNDTSSSHNDVRQGKYQWLIDEWNALETYGIKPIRGLTEGSNRLSMVRARMAQYGESGFCEVIENIKKSGFLQGKGNRGFRATFDWVIKPSNFPKVLEGNYNDNEPSVNINKNQQSQLDWLMNSIREDEQNESNGNKEDSCVDGRFVP